jgi:hypothetical protein
MTSVVLVKAVSLTRVKAPALPFAPVEYQQKYADEVNNILRLYFNQVDTFVNQLTLSSVYIVAKLPDAANAGVGARSFVTDSSVSTFGSTVAGGGSTNVPVYSDGTNWKVG